MKRFWRWGRKAESAAAVLSPKALQGRDSCYFELDEQGQVIDASLELRRLLPEESLVAPVHLSRLLARPLVQVSGSPQHWPSQISLVLRSRNGEDRYFQAGLMSGGEGWLLLLLDSTSLTMRLQYEERRREVLDYSAVQALRMRDVPPAQAHELTLEWLEGLALRLQAPWLGLLSVTEQGWSLYAQYRLPSAEPLGWSIAELQAHLRGGDQRQPHVWRCQQGIARAWLVPYREHDGARVWLAIAGMDTQRQAPFFSKSDWVKLLMLFGAPLSYQVRHQVMQENLQRNVVLQRILDSGWWEFHASGQRLRLAPSLLQLMDVEPEADGMLALEEVLSIFAPVDREQLRLRLLDAAENGQAFTQVACLHGADGENYWFRLRAEVLGESERRVIGYAVNVSDLHQQKAETEAARARLEGLLDNAPAVIFVQSYTADTLRFEFCSASLVQVLGWTLEDLQSNPFVNLVHPEDRDIYFNRTRALQQEVYVSSRYRVRDRRGDYHWFLEEAKLLRDLQGRSMEVVGLLIDITDATEAAARVSESEERYRILVEDSPAIICRYLPDLTLTFANRPMLESLGLDAESLGGFNLGQFLTAEDQQTTVKRLARLTPENPVSNMEFRPQLPSRRYAWWVWSERGIFDEAGRLIEVQAVGRDDTAIHDAREQLYQGAKMATLGEMATGLAHEMNQPLTVMRMALTNLGKRLDGGMLTPEYLREKLQRVEAQINRASKIVDHVRIFGRRSEATGELFDPVQAVEEAVSLVWEGAAQKGIVLEMELEPVPRIKGHRDRLEQVLINLLLNAQYAVSQHCELNPDCQPWIRISARARGCAVVIEVEDNGGGVGSELLDRIFEPFVTTKPPGEGTGLGLSVSYGIIQQMRGELAVDNMEQGACFSIVLPAESADQAEPALAD